MSGHPIYVFTPLPCVTLNGPILGGWVIVVDVTRGYHVYSSVRSFLAILRFV